MSYRQMVRLLVIPIFIFLSLSISHAETINLPSFTGSVVDDAGILSTSLEAALTSKIQAYEKTTTNQVVIVTLPDLMDRSIEEWGLLLGRTWGIGEKGKDNGVVFLIAPNDRELRIEVGYGLEGLLPDAIANKIIQSDVIPYFKKDDLESGVSAGLDAIIASLGGTYQASTPSSSGYSKIDAFLEFIAVNALFCFIILLALLAKLRRRWDANLNRYIWYLKKTSTSSSSRSRSFSSSSGGFSSSSGSSSRGGGSFGGGGASGKW